MLDTLGCGDGLKRYYTVKSSRSIFYFSTSQTWLGIGPVIASKLTAVQMNITDLAPYSDPSAGRKAYNLSPPPLSSAKAISLQY